LSFSARKTAHLGRLVDRLSFGGSGSRLRNEIVENAEGIGVVHYVTSASSPTVLRFLRSRSITSIANGSALAMAFLEIGHILLAQSLQRFLERKHPAKRLAHMQLDFEYRCLNILQSALGMPWSSSR
jgi:hypothetical protein